MKRYKVFLIEPTYKYLSSFDTNDECRAFSIGYFAAWAEHGEGPLALEVVDMMQISVRGTREHE